jgi:hypothetical protein
MFVTPGLNRAATTMGSADQKINPFSVPNWL